MTVSTHELVDHFFRHESAHLIAVLTRAFGIGRLELVEDMVQTALLEAMRTWRHGKIPDHPAGWIHRVARNRILDALRREKTWQRAMEVAGQSLEQQEQVIDHWLEDELLPDSLLRMMFVCCSPELDRQTQVALTLKTLCGFGVAEIASGLLQKPETVKKRLQRARTRLADANVRVDLPPADELSRRRDAVHDVLYLMFNEGYCTSHGADPLRDDICEEAARLCHLLCGSSVATPSTKALLALMLFHAARLESRTDQAGAVVLLDDQDRSKWDTSLMAAGCHWLQESQTDRPSVFHLEAAIARQHGLADSVDTTDWLRITALYDRLLGIRESPVYRLNRAIAIGQSGDCQRALTELRALTESPELQNYPLLHCALARTHELLNDRESAAGSWRAALEQARAPHERQLMERRLRRLDSEAAD